MKGSTEMWTRSSRCDGRYLRASVLRLVRYGALTRSKRSVTRETKGSGGKTEEKQPDRSKHVYTRSILRCRLGVAIRRTKLEGSFGRIRVDQNNRDGNGIYLRSGKRVQTYATESVKVIRLRATGGCRRTSRNRRDGIGRIEAYEYPIIMRLASVGLMRLVNSNDRIGIYLGVEWVSLCMYVRAGFRRGSAYSTEAGLKYYVVGAFGSAMRLLGIARIYGWTGSLNRVEIERRRRRGSESGSVETVDRGLQVGWRRVRSAFLFKLGGVPMHRWLADVYEGSPRTSVRYFAVVPKIAFFRRRMRRTSLWYVQIGSSVRGDPVTNRRIGVSLRSIGVGAIGALTQRRRKRFRAYSTIGHTGYILLGRRRGTVEGVQGGRVYIVIYMVMSMVVWQRRGIGKVNQVYHTSYMDSMQTGVQVRDVKYRTDRYQLGKENPGLGLRRTRTAISMAGVPPIAGFGAKRAVFRALIASSYYRLGRVAVRLSVIGAFNYVRIVKRRYFDAESKNEERKVMVTKGVSIRRGREGRFRTRLRIHPSSLLLMTHRMALGVVGR